MTRLYPTRGNVFLLPDEDHTIFPEAESLVRADAWQPIAQTATVVAVGGDKEDCRRICGKQTKVTIKPEVKVGEKVYFSGNNLGHEILIGDKTLRVLSFDQCKDLVVLDGDVDVR